MRDLFPGWVLPAEETLSAYWEVGTFAIDTSVLLDLYRFSEETRESLLRALGSFGDRLWTPHQVALEFHRNRFGVLLAQREAEKNLLDELEQIRSDLDSQLSQRLRGAGRREIAPLREAVSASFDDLRDKLQAAEKAHTKGLGGSIQDDPIYEQVVALCGDRIGSAFDTDQLEGIHVDAQERIEKKTPPGYMDDTKDGDARHGDVIVWHQLCEQASLTKRPMVLIADDQKADWVWEVKGKSLGPRPELVAEMNEKAGVGFHLYTPLRLLQIWQEREKVQKVEPQVLEEIEEQADSEPRRATKSALLRFSKDALERAAQTELPHWALDTRGETGSVREIPVFATHEVRDNSVRLELHLPAEEVRVRRPLVRVGVTRPDGETNWALVPLTNREATSLWMTSLRYPQEFDAEQLLQPGRYSVTWLVVWRPVMPNASHRDQSTTVDFFSFPSTRASTA